jgi:hypothetical protein
MQLARRPKLRDLVDQETAKLIFSPPMAVVYLRVRLWKPRPQAGNGKLPWFGR